MSKWIGYAVSVNCGEPLGCYQGTIMEADGNTITLTKAFRNGFPYPKSQVTLNAADIKDLKIIETRPEPSGQTHSTVAVTKSNKKAQRATVCENLQANPSSSGNQSGSSGRPANGRAGAQAPVRSKPIDILGTRNNKTTTHAGSYGNANTGSTPKGQGRAVGGTDKARRRNEACFGDAAEPAFTDDFDFEGNLALFDKRALWEQMRNSQKPDLVRQVDEGGKFRHDENVLGSSAGGGGGGGGEGGAGAARRAIRVPVALRGPVEYVTDDGLVVPSATGALRRRLWGALARLGVAAPALALLARAAADVALRLVGGGRRLDPRNAHQAPVAVALVATSDDDVAVAGVMWARLMAAHGARVALLAAAPAPSAALRRELAAAAEAGVALAETAAALPRADVALLALEEEAAAEEALRWARTARGALLALEPSGAGWAGVSCRAAVAALLPPALAAPLGRLYLANVAPPLAVFREAGVAYRPPFGAAAVVALHAADGDE